MNWTLLILFSLFGGIMAILSIKGYTQKIEPVLWLLFSVIVALVLAKNVEIQTFIHALVIGLSWGILNGIIQSAFFDQYLANNPRLVESFKKSTFINGKYLVLITGPMMGLLIGAVMGGMALLMRRIF